MEKKDGFLDWQGFLDINKLILKLIWKGAGPIIGRKKILTQKSKVGIINQY